MPYTPPARSPISSGTTSPLHHRNHLNHSSPPRSPNGRPNLPRSANSTAYLQKSRRSPAYTINSQLSHNELHANHIGADNESELTIPTSLRQSPPPVVDNNQIPPGAILSPPDSTQNSSDDEDCGAAQREDELEKLQEDVRRTLEINHEAASPDDEVSLSSMSAPRALKLQVFSHLVENAALSPSARKISHNRSATEQSFFERRGSLSSQATSDSADSDGDEDCQQKPPLLRKKSGELVKPAIRPSSRRRHSSMPGTPTYSKAVHFNDQIEQVRHFLQVDRPIAVSAGGSPVDSHDEDGEFPFSHHAKPGAVSWDIRLANFPRSSLERLSMPVRVEKLELSSDEKSLIGEVAVNNIAFHKSVTARFTLDYWKTTSEITAEYSNSPAHKGRSDGCDVFTFTIKLSDQANLETRTLLLCVRYNVAGQEFWDSNDGQNYQIDFVKKVKPVKSALDDTKSVSQAPGTRPIPRSRHNSNSSTRGRQLRTLDDDFSSAFEDSTSNIRFRTHNQAPAAYPTTPPPVKRSNNSQQFGVRYDFGASLSAALSQAQAQLGDRSGIKMKRSETDTNLPALRAQARSQPPPINSLSRSGIAPPSASGTESPRPEALLANKQSLDSRAYQEFVSKYCFFGSGKPAANTGGGHPSNGTDGALDDASSTTDKQTADQGSKRLTVPNYVNGGIRTPSPSSSGSSSPTPVNTSHSTPRIPSPPSYGFPFRQEGRHAIFAEAQAATPIQG